MIMTAALSGRRYFKKHWCRLLCPQCRFKKKKKQESSKRLGKINTLAVNPKLCKAVSSQGVAHLDKWHLDLPGCGKQHLQGYDYSSRVGDVE